MEETPDKDRDHMNCEKDQKKEKMTIIPSSNAVVHPWTVMIEGLNVYNCLLDL